MGVALAIQQQGGQRRRQGDGVEHRQHHRERDRQRELLIEPACDAWEEGHRHEHGDQHDANHHDRAEHLAHGVDRRLPRRFLVLGHVPFDVLDHHDRIVDDDAGGEHDAEQRQGVDREVEQLDERKRSDQRHRNGDRRDDRAAPVLEEQEHHDDHEADGFAEGFQHLDDRFADDADVVEGQAPLEARREARLEPRRSSPSRPGRRRARWRRAAG